MNKAIFYHAGCPVCVQAEEELLQLIDPKATQVEVVHLGQDRTRVGEAQLAGVQSVPALVLSNGNVLHINYGASIEQVINS